MNDGCHLIGQAVCLTSNAVSGAGRATYLPHGTVTADFIQSGYQTMSEQYRFEEKLASVMVSQSIFWAHRPDGLFLPNLLNCRKYIFLTYVRTDNGSTWQQVKADDRHLSLPHFEYRCCGVHRSDSDRQHPKCSRTTIEGISNGLLCLANIHIVKVW